MTTQLHDVGEEFILDLVFRSDTITKPTSVTVGLYLDSTDYDGDGTVEGDNLSDSNDLGAITTEPAGTAYARQSVSLDTTDITNQDNSGDWESIFKDLTYDTSDSSVWVDAFFVVASFQSDDKGDSAATSHLILTGSLDKARDLSQVDQFTLKSAGLSLT